MFERTSIKYVYYALQLYSSGLSLRKTSQHLSLIIKGNHTYLFGIGFKSTVQAEKDIAKTK
jgi:hypothetical protein